MEAIALIDFGSTNTKVTAVDTDGEKILARAVAFTTAETDVGEGLSRALSSIEKEIGQLKIVKRFACSSAAGGLRMVASGLVPALTAEAARLAALGAGAKIAGLFFYELTEDDISKIEEINPDIFLLTGGIDGGNKECLLHNARMLSKIKKHEKNFPIIIAGNRSVREQCARLLEGREIIQCPNVLPALDKLDIEPTQAEIRRVFLQRIITARGLSREKELISGILMPTPSAVKRALELFSGGTCEDLPGLGELVALDLGGATTDVYSVASGLPKHGDAIMKGIPEPYSKRTVEGDIGMRYSAAGVLQAAGESKLAQLSKISVLEIESLVANLQSNPDSLPKTEKEKNLDFALAASAVDIASTRHSGKLEEIYTATGQVFVQTGKDLRNSGCVILTGGAIINNPRWKEIASFACYSDKNPFVLKPEARTVYLDKLYILAAMGLLAETMPRAAFNIMKKEITNGID